MMIQSPPPPPSFRTKSTRRVPHPVLIGHVSSLSQASASEETMKQFNMGKSKGEAKEAADKA